MKRGNRGITLLEVAISLGILGTVGWMASRTLKEPREQAESILASSALQQNLFQAMEHLLKVGKISGTLDGSCHKAGPGSLECFVDKSVPPIGNSTKVRFHLQNDVLLYQKYDGATTAWADQLSFPGITGFEICEDAEMKNGTCPLEPRELSDAHTARKGPLFRFFRVRLSSVTKNKSGVPERADLQSAFFVRNPAFPDGNYQWGFQ